MGNSRAAGRRVRQRLAENDGRTVTVQACCELQVTVSVGRVRAAHDAGCPATAAPSTPAGLTARARANAAIAAVLASAGVAPAGRIATITVGATPTKYQEN